MENGALLALILVGTLVIGINGFLFYRLKGGQTRQHIRMWQKAARRARNPWESEDDQLDELSKLVAQLENETSEETAQGPPGV